MRKLVIVALILYSTYVSAAIIGQWKLNEPAGASGADSVKDSIGSNDGTPAKATTTVNSPLGPGQSFDGSQWVTETDQIIADYPLSISIWVRQASNQSATLISLSEENTTAGANDRYVSVILVSGVIWLVTKAATVPVTDPKMGSSLSLNVWHHVVGTWASATDRKLYINGKLEASDTVSHAFPTTNDTWTIGARTGQLSQTEKLTGDLSDVRIYGTALTASDAKKLYDAGTKSARHRHSGKKNTGLARTRGRY